MSLALRILSNGRKMSRKATLALRPDIEYNDGRTKQCFKDECDIDKIMTRFNLTGTISHLAKFEGTYADFSDFDFHEQTTRLTKGREIFDALPAELRQEFGQSPAKFFAYVNDPANINELAEKLPDLAAPGRQLPRTASPDADLEAADAASSKAKAEATKTPPESTQEATKADKA